MEVDIDAVGEQLRIFQDQYKEKSKEYDHLYEKFNQTSQVQQHPHHWDLISKNNTGLLAVQSNHLNIYLFIFYLWKLYYNRA